MSASATQGGYKKVGERKQLVCQAVSCSAKTATLRFKVIQGRRLWYHWQLGLHDNSARPISSIYDQTLRCFRDIQCLKLEMWANAQRDGRPAEYRWHRLFSAAVWLTPTTRMPCSNAAKTRNLLKFAGVPQTTGSISAAIGPNGTPYCEDIWRRYCCLKLFFRLSICALVAKI